MRDLDRLEEMDEAAPSRRVAVLIMAALSTAGLVFAMGILLRGESARGQLEPDALSPLDAIDRAFGAAHAREERETERAQQSEPLDKTQLTFHRSLISAQSPELAAAIEAADAELRSLESRKTREETINSESSKAPLRNLALALAENNDSAVASTEATSEDANAYSAAESARFAPPLPKLVQADSDDDAEPLGRTVDRGYALQVGSYKARADAELFARELENKGYPVFIERATIEGRGEFHRVRIGPFKHRGEALRLRSSFESKERIYPLLIRLEAR